MVTFVQFANDECDYGMGLELGTDLFCHGSHHMSERFRVSINRLSLSRQPAAVHVMTLQASRRVDHAGDGTRDTPFL
ncbi:hypothetical protein CB1_000548028 [Camelus ferus]|nr:hypothetical protein CB1_000548028 [Camelus ferus]